MMRRLLKLHSMVKTDFLGLCVGKFFNPQYTSGLKILRPICSKMAGFIHPIGFRKKSICWCLLLLPWCSLWADSPPSHFMVGPGIFNVDKSHPRFMYQLEFRWDPDCHHVRPLMAYFANTDHSFYLCGGVGYDIFIGKHIVVTPSFAPGWYYQGRGRKLGFPLNFRSGIEAAVILKNQGRIGAQFSHISNARMLIRNPGADSLVFYYAIPLS